MLHKSRKIKHDVGNITFSTQQQKDMERKQCYSLDFASFFLLPIPTPLQVLQLLIQEDDSYYILPSRHKSFQTALFDINNLSVVQLLTG